MREHPLQMVEAMLANGCSLKSIDYFLEGRTHLSEEDRSVLWLLAWSARGNRRQRVADVIEGERHLAGRVGVSDRVDRSGANESVGGRNRFGLGVGA